MLSFLWNGSGVLMSEPVKAALIVAAAIILSTGMAMYFSQFQTCVRLYPDARICWE